MEKYSVHGLEESIECKLVYYPKQSIDSVQSLSSYHGIFQRTRTNSFTICMGLQRTLNSQSSHEKEECNWGNQPA